MAQLLMPKATAVWLIDNTSLTFEQIGDFCGLHPLEIKGIADGDVAQGIKGLDPVTSGQLSREEIEIAQEKPDHKLTMLAPKTKIPERKKRLGPRYTPLSKRQERPDAIYWLIRNHPEISDAQVSKLVGTTKQTIQSIRDRTHWNAANLKAVDPVSLGLCSQIELDEVVKKAAEKKARQEAKARKAREAAGTLLPTDESIEETAPIIEEAAVQSEEPAEEEKEKSAEEVFASFTSSEDKAEEETENTQ